MQIVISVVGTTAGAFGGATFAPDLEPFLVPLFGAYAREIAIGLVVVLVSYLSLVLGELVPKSLGLRYAERYALFVAPLLLGLSSLARPLVWLLTASSNVVLKGFGDKTTFSETRLSPAELRNLVEEATESGALDAHAGDIAARAIDFATLTALHAMVPRTRVVGIPRNAGTEELRRIVLEHAHSVEELVGEVFGERHGVEPASIYPQGDGSVLVAADVPLRDINRELGLELPEGESWSTVGGFCLYLADSVPRQGEVLRSDDGTELHVERASDRAVELIRLVPPS